MAIETFALFVTIYEIFTNQVNTKFDLENEGQDEEDEKQYLHDLTENV